MLIETISGQFDFVFTKRSFGRLGLLKQVETRLPTLKCLVGLRRDIESADQRAAQKRSIRRFGDRLASLAALPPLPDAIEPRFDVGQRLFSRGRST